MGSHSDSQDRKTVLQNALTALEKMQERLDQSERSRTEPIAVVGAGCRLPGAIASLEDYWSLLREGRSGVREIPADRWNVDDYYDPDPKAPGKMCTRYGGFLEKVDEFDAHFFGISPREAASLDPQQRLLLEVAWEALENACIPPDKLLGSETGVFVGITTNDYGKRINFAESHNTDVYAATGNALNAAAGRVAFFLGLQGPCMAIDTACSSSLVAVHEACQSLRTRECDAALAGGVNVILSPAPFVLFSKWGMISPDERCKAFDAAADGFVRGEGCGVVVLKRYSDAKKAGDRILALIRGSAVNQDGRSSGLTVPNGLAQQAVIRRALKMAAVEPRQVGYVEAHGTGTPIGDPIETEALAAVFSEDREPNQPLEIGSVKTNLGHLESASGVAGLLKVILSLQHRQLPPHLHLRRLNPRIAWDTIPIVVPTGLRSWPESGSPGTAGVSSFGFSGTNAHVIVQAAPPSELREDGAKRPMQILAISAQTEKALKDLAGCYHSHLNTPSDPVADICCTAGMGRTHFNHRLAVIGENSEQLSRVLAVRGGDSSAIFCGQAPRDGQAPKVAFLFTGQGSQYVGMGRELFETQPTFRRNIERCDELLRPYLDQPLLRLLYSTTAHRSLLNQTAYTQPALFALEYGLAQLWLSWGIQPSAVMGHSVGEYVAACIAGVFSLEEGLKLISARARLMQAQPTGGRMAAVFADPSRVAAAISGFEKSISLACLNGPQNVVISGAGSEMETVFRTFEKEKIEYRVLTVSHAFHSPLMEPMLDEFERVAARVTYALPRIDLVSNVTGKLVNNGEICSAAYWRSHLRRPVRFSDSIECLYGQGYRTFLELGPGSVLSEMGKECVSGQSGISWLASLQPGISDWRQMLRSLAELYVRGAGVDWEGYNNDCSRRKVSLPTYPFQRSRYWIDDQSPRQQMTTRGSETNLHPLLSGRLQSPLFPDIVYTSTITPDSVPYLEDHVISGVLIFPATGYLEMALAAARLAFGGQACALEDVAITEPLILKENKSCELQLIISSVSKSRAVFKIYSFDQGDDGYAAWVVHMSGRICIGIESTVSMHMNGDDLNEHRKRLKASIDPELFYRDMRKNGVEYGRAFKTVRELWQGKDEGIGRLSLPDDLNADARNYQAHPALLDGCMQVLGATLFASVSQEQRDELYLPVGIGHLQIYEPLGQNCLCYAKVRERLGETITADLHVFDSQGRLTARMEGLLAKRADREFLLRVNTRQLQEWLYRVKWMPLDRSFAESHAVEDNGHWLIFAERGRFSNELICRFEQRGATCTAVYPGTKYQACENGYILNPLEPGHFRQLFEDLKACGKAPLQGIAHLWSLDSTSEPAGAEFPGSEVAKICGSVLHLIQAIGQVSLTLSFKLWLVTRGTQPVEQEPAVTSVWQAALWGLGRVIALEHPNLSSRMVDLEPGAGGDSPDLFIEEVFGSGEEDLVAFRANARYVARLVRDAQKLAENLKSYRLVSARHGVIDSLELQPAERVAPGPGEVEIQVRITGLNFRDVLNVLGMYPGDAGPLGGECVGRISAIGNGVNRFAVGDAVMAVAPGCFGEFVLAPADWVIHKPKDLDYAQAATIPSAFLTAYYGLVCLAGVKKGDRVLIHAAAGGVGLAAVQLARWIGAEVFGTAGNPEKRAYLKTLGVEHVMDSRTLDFADEIKKITDGCGVDIVLNSLTGEFIPESLSVLSAGGRFIELGKAEIWDKTKAAKINPNVYYTAFDLGAEILKKPQLAQVMYAGLLNGFNSGDLKPLPSKTFPIEDAQHAFRFMAQARHIGKILVTHQSDPEAEGASRDPVFQPDAAYLITGGLGGLGLTVAKWMVEQGARHIVLMARSQPNVEALKAIRSLEQKGAAVTVACGDVSKFSDVERIFSQITSGSNPLRGIIHAAGCLNDGLLVRQDWPQFERVLAPKVQGTWLLHHFSRDVPLDFFVLFSSASAVLGSVGQANYAAANAFMDALAHSRRKLRLPAISINWGPWRSVGMTAQMTQRERERWQGLGISAISTSLGTELLKHVLRRNLVCPVVMRVNWNQYLKQYAIGAEPVLLSGLSKRTDGVETAGQSGPLGHDIVTRIASLELPEKRSALTEYLTEQLAKILMLPGQTLDLHQSILTMGLDSLMAVELKNQISKDLKKDLSIRVFLQGSSVSQIAEILLPMFGTPSVLLKTLESAEGSDALKNDSEEWIV